MDDCLYGSARIRALENRLIGSERIGRLLSAGNDSEVYLMLREYGLNVSVDSESGRYLKEQALEKRLQDAYAEVISLVPENKSVSLWRYVYDCNNLKAVLKCRSRGISPDSMLFDFGSVSTEDVKRAAAENDFSALPVNMAKGADDAMTAFAKTNNPQEVDLILDKACYADMLDAANAAGSDFAVRLVRLKIDLLNILTFIRILRMGSAEAGRMFLSDALIPGGTLSGDFYTELYDAGEKKMYQALSYQPDFEKIGEHFSKGNPSLTEIERQLDNAFMDRVRETVFIPYGEEVLISYLLAVEYEVKNIRIVLAGKEAGLTAETIRERVRESYV